MTQSCLALVCARACRHQHGFDSKLTLQEGATTKHVTETQIRGPEGFASYHFETKELSKYKAQAPWGADCRTGGARRRGDAAGLAKSAPKLLESMHTTSTCHTHTKTCTNTHKNVRYTLTPKKRTRARNPHIPHTCTHAHTHKRTHTQTRTHGLAALQVLQLGRLAWAVDLEALQLCGRASGRTSVAIDL